MSPLLNGVGDLERMNTEKAKVLKVFFTLAFIGKTYLQQPQVPEASMKVQSKEDRPLVEEGQVREPLRKLDIYKSMVPDGMHSQLLR